MVTVEQNTCPYAYLDFRCLLPREARQDLCILHEPSLDKELGQFMKALRNKIQWDSEHSDTDAIALDGVVFPADFTWDEAAGDLDISKTVRFTSAKFRGNAFFSGAKFAGGAVFSRSDFDKIAAFTGTIFGADADLSRARFGGDAFFTSARFSGKAGFSGVTFRGMAVFTGATFGDDTDFYGVNFSRQAVFTSAVFCGILPEFLQMN